MSKHPQICLPRLITLMFACLLPGTAALAQNKLPSDILTAANASGRKAEIDAFVHQHLASLKAGGTDVPRSRDALMQQVVNPANVPTQSFLDVYALSLNTEIKAQGLDTATDVRVRLNAAIVVCNVASHANNAALATVTEAFVKDSAEPVSLWGLKSARFIIPSMLLAGDNTKNLATAIINSVKSHPDSDFIPEDAYRALMVDMTDKRASSINSAMLKPYLGYPLSLFEYRVGLYQSAAPKVPDSDVAGAVFFTKSKIWEAMNPGQQAQSVNLTVALANGLNNGTPELVKLIHGCGETIEAVANNIHDNQMLAAAKALATIASNAPQDSIKDQINKLDTLVKARFPASSTALNISRP